MIGAKGFGFASRPNLDAAVADHRQLQALRRDFAKRRSQIVGRSFQPVEIYINPHQLFPGIRSLFNDRLAIDFADISLFVSHSSQRLRLLAQAIDYSLRKFLCSDFLAARTFLVDVVSMDAVFNRAEPGILNLLSIVRLPEMDQHHDWPQLHSRRIGQILTGTARSPPMNP